MGVRARPAQSEVRIHGLSSATHLNGAKGRPPVSRSGHFLASSAAPSCRPMRASSFVPRFPGHFSLQLFLRQRHRSDFSGCLGFVACARGVLGGSRSGKRSRSVLSATCWPTKGQTLHTGRRAGFCCLPSVARREPTRLRFRLVGSPRSIEHRGSPSRLQHVGVQLWGGRGDPGVAGSTTGVPGGLGALTTSACAWEEDTTARGQQMGRPIAHMYRCRVRWDMLSGRSLSIGRSGTGESCSS